MAWVKSIGRFIRPANPGRPKTLVQLLVTPGSPIKQRRIRRSLRYRFNQTRGVVWGGPSGPRPFDYRDARMAPIAARTIARRSNRASMTKLHGTDANNYTDVGHGSGGCGPRDRCFVELYNPWSPTGNTRTNSIRGWIARRRHRTSRNLREAWISRGLSNFGCAGDVLMRRRAKAIPEQGKLTEGRLRPALLSARPVWRLIVVDDWPRGA